MKMWTVSELDNVVGSLKPLLGARLQEVQTAGSDVVLGFYTPSGLLWLWIDMNALRPTLLPWSELPLRIKSEKSPLNLFLRAHFVSHSLQSAERVVAEGRVVRLVFSSAPGQSSELEIRLFPHGRNVVARAGGKQVAWIKPKPLAASETPSAASELSTGSRSLEDLRREWKAARQVGPSSKKKTDVRARLSADLSRKEKALGKVNEEQRRKLEQPWKEIGDWLKSHQTLDVPKEWEPFVDKRRRLSWNIEECFKKAREVDGKLFGTEQRRKQLQEEILRLRQLLEQPESQLPAEPEKIPARPIKDYGIQAQGRTLRLSDDLVVIAGKSAADNLALLRKARAWDLWIHLRDYPSSHAILFRNKNTNVSKSTLQQAAMWFLRHHFGQKYAQHAGERFDILVAECRHVRPIKGDRIGRVTFQNERVLICKIPE